MEEILWSVITIVAFVFSIGSLVILCILGNRVNNCEARIHTLQSNFNSAWDNSNRIDRNLKELKDDYEDFEDKADHRICEIREYLGVVMVPRDTPKTDYKLVKRKGNDE